MSEPLENLEAQLESEYFERKKNSFVFINNNFNSF